MEVSGFSLQGPASAPRAAPAVPLCPSAPVPCVPGAGAISRRTLIALAQLIIRHFDSQGWGTSAWDGDGIDAVRCPWRRRKASGFSKKQGNAFCRPRPGAEGTPGHDHDPFDAASPSDNRALERELNVTGNTRRGAILTIIGDCGSRIGSRSHWEARPHSLLSHWTALDQGRLASPLGLSDGSRSRWLGCWVMVG